MRYQKIETKIWHDEKFCQLTPSQQRLFLYILTCPHGNLTGMFVLKSGYVCEDLKCLPKDFAKDLTKLCESALVSYDFGTSVILIHNFLKHNPITNPNQRKAVISQIEALPKSLLINKFKVLNEGLSEGLPEVLPKPDTDTEAVTETDKALTPPPTKSISKKKIETYLPDDFVISDGVRAWAKKTGYVNLEAHYEAFIDRAKAKAYKYADWDAAFKNAIRGDWAKLSVPGSQPSAVGSHTPKAHIEAQEVITPENAWRYAAKGCRICGGKGMTKGEVMGIKAMVKCDCVKEPK